MRLFNKIKTILELFFVYVKLKNRYDYVYFSIEDNYVTLDLKKKYSYFGSTWLEFFYYFSGSKSILLSMNNTGKMFVVENGKLFTDNIMEYYTFERDIHINS